MARWRSRAPGSIVRPAPASRGSPARAKTSCALSRISTIRAGMTRWVPLAIQWLKLISQRLGWRPRRLACLPIGGGGGLEPTVHGIAATHAHDPADGRDHAVV